MFRLMTMLILLSLIQIASSAPSQAEEQAKPLRIIGFGAHPDDNELRIGGTAILWAQQGHKVKFVSVTNGSPTATSVTTCWQAGHWPESAPKRPKRRPR